MDQIATHTKEYEIKYALASLFGLNEVHSYVWNYEEYNKSVGIEQNSVVKLLDSSHSGQSGLRSALAPTIIKFADENKNKFDNFGIFEIGRVWDALDENNLAVEKKKLAIVLASENKTEKELYFRLKEIVEYISAHIMHINVDYLGKNENTIYHPINSCAISSNGVVLGEMGIMHPVIAKAIDKRKNFAVLELDIEKMLEIEKNKFKVSQTSKYQSTSLDFNFVASKDMKYGEIEKALSEFRASFLLEHSLKDIYINEEVLPGKISYTINFVVTPKDRTLEASDIEKFSARLIDHMKRIGVELRS